MARAWRILRAEGEFDEPKLECERSATFGVMPKPRTASAARMVASAICSAVGSTLTWVSQKNSAPLGMITPDSAEMRETPGRAGITGVA